MLNSQLDYYKAKFSEQKRKNSVEALKDITNYTNLNPEIAFNVEEEKIHQNTSRFAKESDRSGNKSKFECLEPTITFGSEDKFDNLIDTQMISSRSDDRVDTQTGDENYGSGSMNKVKNTISLKSCNYLNLISSNRRFTKVHKRASSHYIPIKKSKVQHSDVREDSFSFHESGNKSNFTQNESVYKENRFDYRSYPTIFKDSCDDESELSSSNLADEEDQDLKMPRNYIPPDVVNSKPAYQTKTISYISSSEGKNESEQSSDYDLTKKQVKCRISTNVINNRYRRREWMYSVSDKIGCNGGKLMNQSKYSVRRKYSNF